MGFLDKVKDAAGKAADQAKHATAVGKEKLEDVRLQKKINDLCEEIGALVVAQRRNEAPPGRVGPRPLPRGRAATPSSRARPWYAGPRRRGGPRRARARGGGRRGASRSRTRGSPACRHARIRRRADLRGAARAGARAAR